MGCGKTSVGTRLAEKLQYQFCDTDQVIEKTSNRTISNIFANEGEEYFRQLETDTIKGFIKTMEKTVLSVGGGLPIREGNAEILQEIGQVIYLKTSFDLIQRRLSGDSSRPLFQGDGSKVEKLYQFRTPKYENAADITILTDGKSLDEIVNEIVEIAM
jgi:shikimate kinase